MEFILTKKSFCLEVLLLSRMSPDEMDGFLHNEIARQNVYFPNVRAELLLLLSYLLGCFVDIGETILLKQTKGWNSTKP